MAGEGHGPSSTTDSPTSSGFNSDQLPPTCPTSANFTEDDYDEEEEEAAVDLVIICDEPKEDEEKDDGEDLFNDPFMHDYRWMNEHDRYELVGLDDSLEDERDLDQIMRDLGLLNWSSTPATAATSTASFLSFSTTKTQMMITIDRQRRLSLISGLLLDQEATMILMGCRIHLEDHSEDTRERMCP